MLYSVISQWNVSVQYNIHTYISKTFLCYFYLITLRNIFILIFFYKLTVLIKVVFEPTCAWKLTLAKRYTHAPLPRKYKPSHPNSAYTCSEIQDLVYACVLINRLFKCPKKQAYVIKLSSYIFFLWKGHRFIIIICLDRVTSWE